MRILIDTHALLWSLGEPSRLGPQATAMLTEPANDVFVSMASLWEIAIKARIGKLRADIEDIDRGIEQQAFSRLSIELPHLAELAGLPSHHRDPFDHLLIAQARTEGLTLMSDDEHFLKYRVALVRCSD